MYQWQKFHIIDELSRYNYNIEIFNPLAYSSLEEANKNLVNKIKKEKYDLFMTARWLDNSFIIILDELKKIGIPSLLICFDNLVVPFDYKKFCKYFDLVWLTSTETKYLFDRWKSKTIFLPYAANPYLSNSLNNKIENENKICFVGNPYGSRVRMLNTLLKKEIPLCLYYNNKNTNTLKYNFLKIFKSIFYKLKYSYGRRLLISSFKKKFLNETILTKSQFLNVKNSVNPNDLASVYPKFSLSLSSTNALSSGLLKNPVKIVNLRNFEIPMFGGLQFCERSSEMLNYFDEDKEIIMYSDNNEMIDKAKFYLKEENSLIVQNMKNMARKRAKSEHSWYSRFKQIFKTLNIQHI